MPQLAIWSRGTQEMFVKQFNKVLNILKFLKKQTKTCNKNNSVTLNSIKHLLIIDNNQQFTTSCCEIRPKIFVSSHYYTSKVPL